MYEGGTKSHEVCGKRVSRILRSWGRRKLEHLGQETRTIIKKGEDGLASDGSLCSHISRLTDINAACLEDFRRHWTCLDDNNQQLWQCRRAERKLNACVFEKLVSRAVNIILS